MVMMPSSLVAANSERCELPSSARNLCGIGLGLRWEFLEEVLDGPELPLAFLEVSPENYMRRGGYYPSALGRIAERYPLVTHGLTLSLGAIDDPDETYLSELRREIHALRSPWHSDHLCFTSVGGRTLHELLPLKWCHENALRVADRLERLQDRLGVPLAFENISQYAVVGQPEMPEHAFIAEILGRTSAGLLLDVNNVYVNSQNFHFDAREFLNQLPLDRVLEIHVAGHERRAGGLVIDTHGEPVCDPVYDLLEWTLERTGPVPVLLERDNAVPPLEELLREVDRLQQVYDRAVRTKDERRSSAPARAR
jgi:hypothetical protein